MKKFSSKSKWLAVAGLVGVIYLSESKGALAQDTPPKAKKMQVKIFQNINGVETMRDTVIEFTGEMPMPDLSELRTKRIDISKGDAKEHELLLNSLRKNGQPIEIKRMEEVFKDGEMPKRMRVQIIDAGPGKNINVDSLLKHRKIRVEKLENLDALSKDEFRMKFERMEPLENVNETRFITENGDSVRVFKRIIILKHELNDDEKNLLSAKAKEKTASGKIKDLNLTSVDLYPNPNTGRFKVSFTAPKKGNTSVAIMDNSGRELFREDLGNFSGKFEKEYNLEGQPKGIYFLQVIQDKKVYNKKVLVQ